MSGKLCFGAPFNNAGAARIDQSKSYCDGIAFRAAGTLVGAPLTGNPHLAGSPDALAWARGWTVADAVAPLGVVDPASAPCCSVPQNVVVDV